MMALDRVAAIGIYRNAHCFARFGAATFHKRSPMNKDVATLLRIDYAQLPDLRPVMPGNMQQTLIANLPAHFGITWRPIEN